MTASRRTLLHGLLGGFAASQAPSWIASAAAQQQATLRVGMSAPNTTLDPHLLSNAPNNMVSTHVFDAIVANDFQSRSQPGLAESWKVLDDTHWEFTMRPNVKFSDGSPLTIEDIKVSIDRAATIPSAASFRTYTRSIKSITEPSPGKMIIETKSPDPLLPNSLGRIRIIAAKFKDAPSPEFNAGRASIGTGPYIYKEYVPGSRIVLALNPHYWGPKPPWSEVTLRIVTDAGARLAALLSGDLDIIEQAPYEGLERIRKDARFQIIRGVSSRFVYLTIDSDHDVQPFITGADGKPLPKNPLKDKRVRQALSMAINRQAIVERVMENNAVAASQFLPPGAPGTSPNVKPAPYDPVKAKALLAEAGYPQGFKLTIHGPNDRIVNDAKIVQVIAQMFTRIGVETKVEVMPWSVYSTKSTAHEFAVNLSSWGVNTGETSNPLLAVSATYNPTAGTGASNSGRYSNPALDAKLEAAMKILDDGRRNALLAEASEIVFNDVAVIPLHHEVLVLGARKDIAFTPRADQYTLAMDVTRKA
ncbi:ABC transporter substrate-binding protein [Terrarubrum flagellatum]|uniref:ABC transporter substrate-binding protein n=1 Tax=Terrirubrum flagellatum TaxID=2895980 RepID=UPI00314532F4